MNRYAEGAHSDRILEGKIQSLHPPPSRYYERLLRYFRERGQTDSSEPSDKRYKALSEMTSGLWTDSSKGDPAIFTLADRFEPILQEIPRNRDHRIHSSNVFLLGYYVVNRIKEIDSDFDFKTNDPNLTWMLTATFHDIGYAIQETEFWLNKIFEEFLGVNPKFTINMAQVVPMIYSDFMRILSAYHEKGGTTSVDLLSSQIDWLFYNEVNSKLIEKNHGVLSALMLAHLLGIRKKFLVEKERWNFRINHLPACHAIATHTLPSISVSFVKHPLAFLLILCDEIQDWGRSRLSKESQDNICLRDIEVLDSRPVEVRLCIKTSRKRQKELRDTLSRRLRVDGRITITVTNVSGNPIVEIRDTHVQTRGDAPLSNGIPE